MKKIDIYVVVRKNIKKYRIEKNITQAELARRLGVTRAYINKLESDKYHSVSKKLVKRLCEVFEVDAFDLFDIDILKIVPRNSKEFEKVIYILEKERKKYETEKTN